METGAGIIFPNLFIMLLARPGVGKSLIANPVKALWDDTLLLRVGSQTTTSAAVIDQIKRAKTERRIGGIDYNSSCLLFASSEFGSLTSSYDQALFSRLSDIYDGRPDFKSETRGGGEIILENPLIHLLVGAQPQFLASMLPESAWQQGFMARFHLIHSDEKTELSEESLFYPKELLVKKSKLHAEIVKNLKKICHFHGQFTWELNASKEFYNWIQAGLPPVPTHPKLETYSTRRLVHICKLCMIIAASSFRHVIQLKDLETAKKILFESEENLGEVFHAMVQTSTGDQIEQIYHWLLQKCLLSPEGISMTTFQNYLGMTVGIPMLERMYDHLQISDVIRVTGDKVLPGERNNG